MVQKSYLKRFGRGRPPDVKSIEEVFESEGEKEGGATQEKTDWDGLWTVSPISNSTFIGNTNLAYQTPQAKAASKDFTKRVLTILLVIDDFHFKVSGKVKNYSRVMRGCESNDFIMGGVKLGIRLYRWWY